MSRKRRLPVIVTTGHVTITVPGGDTLTVTVTGTGRELGAYDVNEALRRAVVAIMRGNPDIERGRG